MTRGLAQQSRLAAQRTMRTPPHREGVLTIHRVGLSARTHHKRHRKVAAVAQADRPLVQLLLLRQGLRSAR
jgi:hypothetical protein